MTNVLQINYLKTERALAPAAAEERKNKPGKKKCLIQLFDELSVKSPDPALFSDWLSKYIELYCDWLPDLKCDFWNKKYLTHNFQDGSCQGGCGKLVFTSFKCVS